MRILFFTFFYFFLISIYAQKQFEQIDKFLYNTETQLFEIISNDSIYCFDLNKQLLETSFLITENFQIKAINPISGDNFSYYPSNQTGVVVNKIFERIDKTKSKSFFINSSFFINNDTLFRVGGYGFWTKYRGLSYFNINDKVWYPYQLNAVDSSYPGLLNPKISRVDNTSYVLYAGKTFDDKNPLEEYPNFKVFVLDFKSKSIIYSGKTKQTLDGPRIITFQDNTLIFKKTRIERLDWSNNIVEFFNCNWTHQVSQKHNIFLINDQFYFIQEVDDKFILTSVFNNIDSLITQKKAIYESKKMSKLIYLLLVLIVIVVLYFLNKKYNTLYVHHNYLSYKNKKIGINSSEYKILKVLHDETKITTNNIHHILSNKVLHPNHIYRLIPEVMRDLNKTLVLLLSNNNLVFSVSKNKIDRRIREYTFNLNIRMVFKS
jgi:hypothetical protein